MDLLLQRRVLRNVACCFSSNGFSHLSEPGSYGRWLAIHVVHLRAFWGFRVVWG